MSSKPSRVTILCVDDSPEMLLLLRALLEKNGYHVHEAENGRDALEQLKILRPALVISDIDMPIVNGWQLAQAIADDPAIAGTPILGISAAPPEVPRNAGQVTGFTEFIEKPFAGEKLLRAVRALIGKVK